MDKNLEWLEDQAGRNLISRREFLRRAVIYTGSWAAAVAALRACSPAEDPTPTSAPVAPTKAPAEVPTATPVPIVDTGPKTGGTLITARSSPFTSLDPQLDATEGRARVSVLIYSTLVRMTNDGVIVGDLAESWENPDPNTWIFHLRSGVKWHDGTPFTSADVKYTLERVLDEDVGVAGRTEFLPITGITTPDDLTVKMTTDEPYSGLLSSFGGKYGAIVQKAAIEKWGDLKNNAMGTGPFMVEEWMPDSHLRLVKNPSYHHEGLPYLDGIEWQIVPDETNIIAALRAGTVHHTMLEDRQLADLVSDDENLVIQTGFTTGTDSIWANRLKEPFNIPGVCKAIDLALDREAIIQAATGGYAVLSGLVSPALSQYALPQNELAELYKRDIPRAKELLAEAGFPDGMDMELQNIGGYAALTAGAQVVVENLKEIGINAEINTLELGQWIDQFVNYEYGISMNSGSGALDPDIWFRYIHSQPEGKDWQTLNDPELDELTESIRRTVDIDKRIELVHELQTKVIEKGALIILYSPLNVEITQNTVEGYEPHPLNWSYNFDSAWLNE